jgi:uncharacterized membrane protein YdjX (TVP38/TMEM64 family)
VQVSPQRKEVINLSSFNDLIAHINQFGIFAPLVAFILFTLQAFLPIFPYVFLATAGGVLFGFKLGFLLAWLGALSGACLAYWMCRLLGNTRFMVRYYTLMGYDVRKLNGTLAFWTIVITRILPVVPTPLINVAAALGGVSFPNFFASSALGKIPTAVLYTGLGLALFNAKDIHTVLLIIGLTLLVLLLLKYQAQKWFPLTRPDEGQIGSK